MPVKRRTDKARIRITSKMVDAWRIVRATEATVEEHRKRGRCPGTRNRHINCDTCGAHHYAREVVGVGLGSKPWIGLDWSAPEVVAARERLDAMIGEP
jgi:hypothetical protein